VGPAVFKAVETAHRVVWWVRFPSAPVGYLSFDMIWKAFESAVKCRSACQLTEFVEKFLKIVDFDAHRSQILRVVHCVQQEQPMRQRPSR